MVSCGLTKRYKNGKLAVSNLHLKVEDKQIFGLLGPNGAGKTTLLSMITGIFSPTSGNGYVAGYSVVNQIDSVHLYMGVCPQFDLLWPSLTVEEHLYFYSRLRGVSRKDEKEKVQETLEEVNLIKQRNFQVSQLSGGMKRRLSIGISLVGDPRIVFMDEPTSGLDPENRRHLWEVLSKCRAKRSIFLTTHMMEEAEALCDRIGVITNGVIRTVGDQFRLKSLYGKGYFVTVSVEMSRLNSHSIQVSPDLEEDDNSYLQRKVSIMSDKVEEEDKNQKNWDRLARIKAKVMEAFHPATVAKEISGLIKLNVAESRVSVLLETLQALSREEPGLEWAISESTLEDVFLEVVARYDPKFEKPSLLESVDPMVSEDLKIE